MVVYKIIFPNGKHYIGQTMNFSKRMSGHYSKAYKYNNHSKLYNAIRKYGWDNLVKEVIFESDIIKEINNAEINYIVEYKSLTTENGYNVAKGGQYNCGGVSEETKAKQSAIMKTKIPWIKGKLHTDETKSIISKKNLGRKLSEETRIKMSNKTWTDETRNKLSKARKRFVFTSETRMKMSESAKMRGGCKWSKESIEKRSLTRIKLTFLKKFNKSIHWRTTGIEVI